MIANTERVHFGDYVAYRQYCDVCESWALVIDGKLACCDAQATRADTAREVRECETDPVRRHMSKAKRRAVLDRQHYKCIYCGVSLDEFGGEPVHFDHFVPWSYCGSNRADNYVAACDRCNLHKSDKVFANIDEARVNVLLARGLM